MHISDIRLLRPALATPATPEDLAVIKTELHADVPPGYTEFISTFGEGLLATLIRVLPPRRVVHDTAAFRQRINEYWFWTGTPELLTKDRAVESIVIADTIQGDELIFHPERPDRLFYLPRGGDDAYYAGDSLLKGLEWILTSRHKLRSRDFEPLHRPLYLIPLSHR